MSTEEKRKEEMKLTSRIQERVAEESAGRRLTAGVSGGERWRGFVGRRVRMQCISVDLVAAHSIECPN